MKKRYIFLTLTLCFFGVINTYAQVPSYVPTDSLVAWWPFSGNAIDSSGNSNFWRDSIFFLKPLSTEHPPFWFFVFSVRSF